MRVPYTLRTRGLALVCAAVAVLTVPAVLFAHARLIRSTPAANGRLENPPIELKLWFSERPELQFTSIQLLDSAGGSIPLGAVAPTGGDRTGIVVPIAAPVVAGRYTVVWRTAAADGHATNGRFAFTVAVGASAVPRPASAPSLSPTVSSGVTRRGTGGAALPPNAVIETRPTGNYSAPLRWVELTAVLTLVGAVLFRLFILPPAELAAPVFAESADRARRLAHAALALFILATLTRVFDQSNLIAGAASARMAAVMSVIEGTRWGHGWLVGLRRCGARIDRFRDCTIDECRLDRRRRGSRRDRDVRKSHGPCGCSNAPDAACRRRRRGARPGGWGLAGWTDRRLCCRGFRRSARSTTSNDRGPVRGSCDPFTMPRSSASPW